MASAEAVEGRRGAPLGRQAWEHSEGEGVWLAGGRPQPGTWGGSQRLGPLVQTAVLCTLVSNPVCTSSTSLVVTKNQSAM